VPLSAQFTPAGRLLFVTHVGVVYVLERATGEPVVAPVELVPDPAWDPATGLWACARGTQGCPSANTIAVDPRSGRFYFTFFPPGAAQAGVRAMEVREGDDPAVVPVWTNDALPGGSGSSPVLSADGSRLYVTDNVDSVHAIDTATGESIWTFPIGFASAGSLSVSPGGLLIPSGGPLMALRDAGDHARLLWRAGIANLGIATQSAGGRAYVVTPGADGSKDLVVVDVRTGDELDREPLPAPVRFGVGTTIGNDGTVFVPTIDGDLFAFRR
jgi:outer membrane protein assembly factor BamB